MIRQISALAVFVLATLTMSAQQQLEKPFSGYLYNKEHNVYMRINLHDEDVVISWQELFGQLPGYLSKEGTTFCWIITSASIDGNVATLQMINDYGSEDLTATLTQTNDSIYTLQQINGATLKVPNKGKWSKLPKTIQLLRKK